MNNKKQAVKYILSDLLSAIVAWGVLFLLRKALMETAPIGDVNQVFTDANFWRGIVIIPIAWIMLYALQGTYRDVYRKSRLKELQQTASASVFGVTVIFFALMLDDELASYRYYYLSFLLLLLLHFTLTYVCRLLITSRTVRLVHTRQIGFPTLLIGTHAKAYQTYLDLENQETYSGNIFVGCVSVNTLKPIDTRLSAVMPPLGTIDEMKQLIRNHHVEEVIIAVEDDEQQNIQQINHNLFLLFLIFQSVNGMCFVEHPYKT